MSLYNSPFIPPQLLQKGVPAYLFGGLNMLRGNAKGTVSQTAIATNVGTITVQLNEGATPVVGDYLTVWGTALQSSLFNVTRSLITAVNITPGTGAGTISYALTGTNQSATADPGRWMMEIGETSEALTTTTFSAPVCVQAPQCDSQFTIPLAVTCPSMPTAATFTLQRSIRDIAAEYTNTGAVVTIAGGVFTAGPTVQATLERGYFYRLAVTGVSGGTSPSVIAKVG
jgi:hypothetical protein